MTAPPAPPPAPRSAESTQARLSRRFQQLADDIFALEINTILKDTITATPWPGPGHGLLDIASEYQAKLIEIQQQLAAREPALAELAELAELRRRSENDGTNVASHARFDALRTWAKALCPALERARAGHGDDAALRATAMIHRIRDNSDQIKGVFEALRLTDLQISRHTAGDLELPLREQDLSTVRKVWEIGTEEVVMQTVIHLDGDVMLRVRPDFAGVAGKPVLDLHHTSVQTSVGFWQAMVGVIGSALRWFLGK